MSMKHPLDCVPARERGLWQRAASLALSGPPQPWQIDFLVEQCGEEPYYAQFYRQEEIADLISKKYRASKRGRSRRKPSGPVLRAV